MDSLTTPAKPDSLPEGFTRLDADRWYAIPDDGQLAPFFMTVVGANDCWLFISSTGGLTAGRHSPNQALFPYYSDDKVTENAGNTGGLTVIRAATSDGATLTWRPFTAEPETSRRLLKTAAGDAVMFEESHAGLGLTFRVRWSTSQRFGLVRHCTLISELDQPRTIDVVDGVQNLLAAGVTRQVQNELSNLLNAYRRSELDPRTGLGIFTLSSLLTDLAEPSESLAATVAWSVGLDAPAHLLSTHQLPAAIRGGALVSETEIRGERAAYLVASQVTVSAERPGSWWLVCDVGRDAAQVVDLQTDLDDPAALTAALIEDYRGGRERLRRIIAGSDGEQLTSDELSTVHHWANVLFNSMRGGVPNDGYTLDGADVARFVRQRNTVLAAEHQDALAAFPPTLQLADLLAWGRTSGDPDLERLTLEYLPLTFSRRHGDPTRPWNNFDIQLLDQSGGPILGYEGNWRDIFQNWEALSQSFPEYLESMIVLFLNATTADGYNPYRITRAGIDWEVPEPENPWSNIGYWSDHQINYLIRLLERSAQYHPGRISDLLNRPIFTHADVPYRIKGLDVLLADPRDSIVFDEAAHTASVERVAILGGDGRLLRAGDDLVRVSLAEKLLLLLAAKLVNVVPEGGVWMNTQRPEWNDANNALAGPGLSVVTLGYLRRYVAQLQILITESVTLSPELAELLAALSESVGQAPVSWDDASRHAFLIRVGRHGERYRNQVYRGFSSHRIAVSREEIQTLLSSVLGLLDRSLAANRRPDGLFHAYNILSVEDSLAQIGRLPLMLEGQVSLLSSGVLDAQNASDLLSALRTSQLFRADQHSYLLYPDRQLPGFLVRNVIPADFADSSELFALLDERGDRGLAIRDGQAQWHFAAGLRNVRDVRVALDRLHREPALAAAVAAEREAIITLYEEVFQHRSYTGRSGSFFAFEGLGSIYWHMVSKLLLATQENLRLAHERGADPGVLDQLADHYADIRAGLGSAKTAAEYGAFPTDPYSHTPAGSGARQPGMTGQVKEEILTRLGELGLAVSEGRITPDPSALRPEWLERPTVFDYLDITGREAAIDVPAGAMAFTFCQVPVVIRPGPRPGIRAELADGRTVAGTDGRLSPALSAAVFQRTGEVRLLRVTV